MSLTQDKIKANEQNNKLISVGQDLVKKGILIYDGNKYILNPSFETQFETSYKFDSIAMQPQKNICNSRLDASIESEVIRGVTLSIPIISANMASVTNAEFAIKMYNMGGLGILHRAWKNTEEYFAEVLKISNVCKWTAASIGVDNNAFNLTKELVNRGVNIICIDIANAYSDNAISLGRKIKNEFKNIKLIIGNTTNINFIYSVLDFADAIKIGIGSNSSVCTTYDTTGFTEHQFSAVYKFKYLSRKYGIPVISDGGCRKSGDFCKAIAAGANSVMMGTILNRCIESAGETVTDQNGSVYKIYAGMSSRMVQDAWKGGLKQGTCPEGKNILLPIGENLELLLNRYAAALRSSITYSGQNNVVDFQDNVKFIKLK